MARRQPNEYNWKNLQFDETYLTKHFTKQNSKKVKFVGIHHAVIRDTDPNAPDGLNKLWNIWQTRKASAQYGVDGRFVRQFVRDKDYAWASGNYSGNKYGIHIEHINKTLDQPGSKNDYLVSEETWKTGARLVAHIHVHHRMGRPIKNVTVRKHSSWKSTACPGPYLGGEIWDEYVLECQRVYDQLTRKPVVSKPPTFTKRGESIDHAISDLKKAKGTGARAQLINQALDALKKIKPFY